MYICLRKLYETSLYVQYVDRLCYMDESWISSLMTDAGTNTSLRQRFLVHVQVLD
jgi:hypothetical protein